MAPAVSALMLSLLLFLPKSMSLTYLQPSSIAITMTTATLSNQFYGAYFPSAFHSFQNAWEGPRLVWTNGRCLPSTITFLPVQGTNFLP